MNSQGMVMERKGWVAALLGLIMPGLGQIYNGEALKGICVFIIFIMVYVAGMDLAVLLPDKLVVPGAALATIAVLAVYLASIIESYRKARQAGSSYRGRSFNRWYAYLAIWMVETVVIMGGVVGYVKQNVVQAFKIPSASMEPRVLRGDRILVDKSAYRRFAPKVGDIVVFVYPDDRSKIFLKQIAALPGMTVKLPDGHQETVPHGQAYLLGANAAHSIDSRSFGFVPLRDLEGKARQVYWSTGPEGVRWQRIGVPLGS